MTRSEVANGPYMPHYSRGVNGDHGHDGGPGGADVPATAVPASKVFTSATKAAVMVTAAVAMMAVTGWFGGA